MAEETNLVVGTDTAAAGEDLKGNLLILEANDLGKRNAAAAGYFGEVAVGDVVGFNGDYVTGDLDNAMINLTHWHTPSLWRRWRRTFC